MSSGWASTWLTVHVDVQPRLLPAIGMSVIGCSPGEPGAVRVAQGVSFGGEPEFYRSHA